MFVCVMLLVLIVVLAWVVLIWWPMGFGCGVTWVDTVFASGLVVVLGWVFVFGYAGLGLLLGVSVGLLWWLPAVV